MKNKMIVLFVFILLIVIFVLSASGTTNNIKTYERTYVNHSYLIAPFISRNSITSDWSEQKLLASDGAVGKEFGYPVSIDGDYAIIGAPHDDDMGNNSGSAYIFKNDGTSWIEIQKLTASDGAESDLFGYYLSISGDYAIIGAPHDDDMGPESGSAYIFKNNGTSWIEEQKLTASDGAESDLFGFVFISGDYAIIGAPYDDDIGSNSGSAYIFKNNGSSWIEEQKLHTSHTTNFIGFGVTLSISRDYAIIGAPYDDDMGSNSGSAYIFKNNGTSWIEEQKLTASDGAADDWFGRCIFMDGNYAIIGAPHDDDMGPESGSTYIFKNNGTSWIEEQKLTASDGAADDWFGRRVSIDNNYAIVGAENDDVDGEDYGSAYIFKCNGISWVEEAKLLASDGAVEDYFGTSVSIDGNYAIVGAALDDNNNGVDAGSVYVFERINKPPNTPTIDGPNSGKTNTEYNFTFKSTDPDDDNILEYVVDWGDGTGEETISGPFASGEEVTSSHSWTTQETFTIKAKAKDINGAKSNWSEFDVTIPRIKTTVYSLFYWFIEQFPMLENLLTLIRVI